MVTGMIPMPAGAIGVVDPRTSRTRGHLPGSAQFNSWNSLFLSFSRFSLGTRQFRPANDAGPWRGASMVR